MLKLGRVTKVKGFFLVLVYVFDIDLFEFSAAILEKGLFDWILLARSSIVLGLGAMLLLFVYHFLNQSCETFRRASWQPTTTGAKEV